MENEKYDFFTMGMRQSYKITSELDKIAKEIGEKYGEDAKLEFEAGIAVSVVPQYGEIYKQYEEKGMINGTKDYGEANMRNNSYFDESGVSNQYIDKKSDEFTRYDGVSVPIYNEPKEEKKGRSVIIVPVKYSLNKKKN